LVKQWLLSALVAFVFVTSGQAQILESHVPTKSGSSIFAPQSGAYYNFSEESGCDLKVSVWGFVSNPGRYFIPCETNLLELLSFCGGPKKGAELDHVKIVRRGGADRENELKSVFEVDIAKYLDVTDVGVVSEELLLFPGDLVIIEGEEQSTVDTFLRVAQVVVAITSLVTATVAIINISK